MLFLFTSTLIILMHDAINLALIIIISLDLYNPIKKRFADFQASMDSKICNSALNE